MRAHIIHARHLTNRAPIVNAIMQALKPICKSVDLVAEHDPTSIRPDDVKLFTNTPVPDAEYAYFNAALKPMSVTAISNALKHRLALTRASEDPSCLHLIVEDDSIFTTDFASRLPGLAADYQTNSVLFMGVPVKTDGATVANVFDAYKVLPSCDAYLVDAATAKAMLQEFNTGIRFPCHLQLTYAALKHSVALKAVAPTATVDGTKFGIYASTINVNNPLMYNGHYLRISTLLAKKDELSKDEITQLDTMFTEIDYKMNPEFFYLKAVLETRKKNIDFAMALYSHAYKMYQMYGTPLTQGSDFMRDYMKMFVHVQD